ncbi:aspartyl/asparaginyl beta-hydroxylase domain-containing protein [Streptomyces sp. NPDC101118]|uniref:aspartyl/asparaginyl beta-hydroxylase domain-containing protein n=1 Tax=Streptomyces sp. NPDC101118 TaxID=3366109 RepID=UPI0038249E1B
MSTEVLAGAAVVPMPAAAARLSTSFNAGWLAAELRGVRPPADDWRCLVLRSPGGPGDWTDAPLLDRFPHVRYILDTFPAPVFGARFMCRRPGTGAAGRIEAAQGLRWGTARLHVPVQTNTETALVLDGEVHRWAPGDLWFGDFTRTHQVLNHGKDHCVHLALDVPVTERLVRAFPVAWREFLLRGDVLVNRPPRPLAPGEAAALAGELSVPAGFLVREDEDPFRAGQARTTVTLEPADDRAERLWLRTGGGRVLPLTHLGGAEFRFAGRSEERTLRVRRAGGSYGAVLYARTGRGTAELAVPGVTKGSTDPRGQEEGKS